MIKKVEVDIPATGNYSYPILLAPHLLLTPAKWLPKKTEVGCIVIITDQQIKKYYGNQLAKTLMQLGYRVFLFAFPAGEKSKVQKTKERIEASMFKQQCGRDTVILALGGGVVGDIAGFTAATYMRGIRYYQLPTSLLAMIDSSVGGKTAIDTPYGKNLIGAFWQPRAVIADITCLKTLPKKQLINGLIEAIKMFLTHDAACFTYAKKNLSKLMQGNTQALTTIIYQAVKIKAGVVTRDEKEKHERMTLNFGHTIGHAIEQLSNYRMLHGIAVGYGILVEAKMAQLLGLLSDAAFTTISHVFRELGIQGKALKAFSSARILQSMRLDKKASAGNIRCVLLEEIGSVYVVDQIYAHQVDDDLIKDALQAVVKG